MRRLTLFLLVALSLLSLDGWSQNRSITFVEKPWQEILAQARAEQKIIFLDAYASWCGPCKWMAANMFTIDSIADFYNRSFLCTHVDMEKGEGPGLAMKYQVSAYPTLLFIAPDGSLLHRKVGASRVPDDYIRLGQEALSPDQNLAAFVKRYTEGERSPAFMLKYFSMLSDAYIPVAEPLQEYLASQSEDQLFSRTDWEIIFKYLSDMDSPTFLFLLKHEKEYAARYTEDSVNMKVNDMFDKFLRGNMRNPAFGFDQVQQKQQIISSSGFPKAAQVNLNAELTYYQLRGEIQTYLELARREAGKTFAKDPDLLINTTFNLLKMSSDSIYLRCAQDWVNQALSQENSPSGQFLLSNIRYRMGNYPGAISSAEEALKLAREQGLPLKDYEENLRRVQEQPKN